MKRLVYPERIVNRFCLLLEVLRRPWNQASGRAFE
jgi:hypothetical protein